MGQQETRPPQEGWGALLPTSGPGHSWTNEVDGQRGAEGLAPQFVPGVAEQRIGSVAVAGAVRCGALSSRLATAMRRSANTRGPPDRIGLVQEPKSRLRVNRPRWSGKSICHLKRRDRVRRRAHVCEAREAKRDLPLLSLCLSYRACSVFSLHSEKQWANSLEDPREQALWKRV
jgi:hypothetical protein